ncbi:MAG: hypothetical protein ACRD3F_02195 [Acidobacteriaceae bacterium]
MLEIGKALSFAGSILSLYALLGSAFFVPGSRWQDRLIASIARIVIAACVCFASGLLFREESLRRQPQSHPTLTSTLPVRLFFWGLSLMAVMFLLSWSLDTYYVPHLWRNQPW